MGNRERQQEAEARIRDAVARLQAAGQRPSLNAVVAAAGCSKATAAKAMRALAAVPPAATAAVPARTGGTVIAPEHARALGQRSKLTPEVAERIAAMVAEGVSREGAAQAVGIGRTTLLRWLQQGREEEEGPYRDLWDAIEKADGQCEAAVVGVVRRAAESGTWQAAAWLGERKWPERYGRADRLSVVGGGGGDVRIVVEHVADWHARDIIEVEPQPSQRNR